MARRATRGNVRKRRDGRWEARIVESDGRRRSLYAKTKREVQRKLAEALTSEPKQTPSALVPEKEDVTLSDYLKEYLSAIEGVVKPRTLEVYSTVLRLHVQPGLGERGLANLSVRDVQNLYSEKIRGGLSGARVHCIHRTLTTALNMAVRWGYIEENPTGKALPPRISPPEIRPLTRDEARELLKAAKREERYYALYALGITTGARWGELTGLFWSDLDFEARRMRIERACVRTKESGHILDTPKTRNSRRTVPLTRLALEALESHRELQREAGIPASGRELVFTSLTGGFLHSSNFIRRSFKPTLKRAGLPDTNWHAATRHTATCLLLLDRVDPKSVCLQMGWSSVSFMLENYARFMPGWGDSEAMDRILGEELF